MEATDSVHLLSCAGVLSVWSEKIVVCACPMPSNVFVLSEECCSKAKPVNDALTNMYAHQIDRLGSHMPQLHVDYNGDAMIESVVPHQIYAYPHQSQLLPCFTETGAMIEVVVNGPRCATFIWDSLPRCLTLW